MGTISYTGRIVIRKGESADFTQSSNGTYILRFNIAEQHQTKKKNAKRDPALAKYADLAPAASDDDYINTTTSWHKLTIIGDKAEEYALDPAFNHGSLVVVDGASYVEEGDWQTKDGVMRAGRPETIGDRNGGLTVKFPPRVPEGESAPGPIWDGESTVKKAGGGGQSSNAMPDYSEQGF